MHVSRRRDSTGVHKVDIEFVRTGNVAGASANTITHDVAGDANASPLRTLNASLMFTGGSSSSSKNGIDVVTRDIPEDLNDRLFWRANVPGFFDDVNLADIVIHDAKRAQPDTAGRYPRVCVNTALPDLLAADAPFRARLETFSCLVDFKRIGADKKTVDVVKNTLITVDLITTSARTQRYEWTESARATAGDDLPHGIAQKLLDTFQGSGAVTVRFALDVDGAPIPPLIGETFEGLPCQRCSVSLWSRECVAEFTPSPEQSLEDRAKLITGFRARSQSRFNRKTRETGEVQPDSGVNNTKITPTASVVKNEGERNMLRLTGATDPTLEIILDPDDITVGGKSAQMRAQRFPVYDPFAQKTYIREFSILSTEGKLVEEYNPPCSCGCPDNCTCCKCKDDDDSDDGGGGTPKEPDACDEPYPGAPQDDAPYPVAGGTSGDGAYPAKKYKCW